MSKSLFYLISLWSLLPLITLSFPSLTVEAAVYPPACLTLWPYILSVSCWFAFLRLCLEDDVLEDSIPGHLFTVSLFLQQSNKFLLFSVQFSHSVMSDSLQPHELQHARPPCPSPTPRIHPNPCPSSRWCHPTISSSVIPFSSCPQSAPASGSFQMSQSVLHIRWPKYWSFSFNISPSNEYLGLIAFRMD